MPIYSDYHSDFQNSTNSSWDQIQIILKCLLPSNQPLPSDSQSSIRELADQNATGVVERPPPEPPDLHSPVEELFPIQTPTCQTMVAENEYENHSGAEDGAVAKGKVDIDLEPAETEDDATASDADEAKALSHGSVVGDSAAAKREQTLKTTGGVDLSEPEAKHQRTIGNCWYTAIRGGVFLWHPKGAKKSVSGRAEDGAVATVMDGGLLTRRLRRFVSLTPSPS